MSRTVKTILIALGALIGLLLVAVAILAATFDPNDYKPQIIRTVQEKTQRTLTIPGDISLTFFPKIGADLGQLSLSERNSTEQFVSVNSARVSLALIPLLSKQVVVDQVRIDGLRASIKRFKDGTTNFDDLVAKQEEPAKPEPAAPAQEVGFDIGGIDISDAQVLFDDRQQGRKLEISGLNLETGKIAEGVASDMKLAAHVKGNKPVIDANVAVASGFTFDLGQKHFILKGTDATIKGRLADFSDLAVAAEGNADLKPQEKRFVLDGVRLSLSGKSAGQAIDVKFEAPKLAITDTQVSGGKLAGEAKMVQGARTINATFSVPTFEGSPQAFKVPTLALDVAVLEAALDAKAKITGSVAGDIDKMLFTSPEIRLALSGKQGDTVIDGTLTTPFSANMTAKLVELPKIAAALRLPNPAGGSLKLDASGNVRADLDKQNVAAALKGKLDESAFDAKLGMKKFTPAAYTFDINIDRFNADRYKSKTAAAAPKAQEKKPAGEAPAEQPIDLSGLKDLQATGSLRVGALTVENIKASNVRVDLRAGDGKIAINPVAASLYGGSLNGSLAATASQSPSFAVRQNLTGIHIGPLLQDAIGKAPVEGRGNVQLDITTQGGVAAQLKKQLNGTARLELRDGAVRGVNIAEVIRNAKTRIGQLRGDEAPQTGTASAGEKTDFSEMSASFRIANGVARNDDLSAKSPLIRVTGAGEINLAQDRLDYLVKATVVSTLQGQGGPELEALKGLTVPVRLSGPFDAIGWGVDFKGMASALAQQKLDAKKEEVQERAKKEVEEQKGKIEERLRGQLKGLLGK